DRAALHRGPQTTGHHLDRPRLPGAKRARGHLGAETHGAAADNRDHVARPHVGLAYGVVAGREDVADEQQVLVAEAVLLWDLPQREVRLGNAHVLRLGAGQVAEGEAQPEHADRHALHRQAAAAEPALAAVHEERAHRALALFELGHALALRLDRAQVLVTQHETLLDLHPAVIRMQVG